MMSQVFLIFGKPTTIERSQVEDMITCLMQWQQAGWSGDAYKYCEACDERDAILNKLLGEGNASSRSEQPTTNNNPTIGDN